MLSVIESKERKEHIDTDAVVRYLGKHTEGEFDEKRCEKEYDRMVDHIENIRQTPVYRWPKG